MIYFYDSGTAYINITAVDIYGWNSENSVLEVSVPKNRCIYDILLDRFPLLDWLFNQITE